MLTFGLQVTLLGIGVVFVILVATMFIMQGMSAVLAPKKKDEPKIAAPVQAQAAPVAVVSVQKEDEDELSAVIAAAIAACGHQVVVKAITRVVGTNGAAWSATGRTEAMSLRQL